MLIYNVGFINVDGKEDEVQLDIEEHNSEDAEMIELINLVLSLKDEIGIKEVTHINYVGIED